MLGGGGQNVHGDQSLLVAAEELRFLSPLCSGNLLGCVHALLKVSTIDCCCPCKRAAPAYNQIQKNQNNLFAIPLAQPVVANRSVSN